MNASVGEVWSWRFNDGIPDEEAHIVLILDSLVRGAGHYVLMLNVAAWERGGWLRAGAECSLWHVGTQNGWKRLA